MKTNIILLLILCLSVQVFSCSPKYNLEKTSSFKESTIDLSSIEEDKSALIFASFSGGGSRATSMSWEVLKEFRQIPYIYVNKNNDTIHSTLADQIDYMSGISGGSFTAAGWCLYKDSMDVFEKKFIEHNIQRSLVTYMLFTPRLFKLVSPSFSRINIASEYYDNKIFNNAQFANVPQYPQLWIGTTIVALGTQFMFNQEHFDFLNSDLRTYPIGYACAASSAFPILLDPIALRNYGTTLPDSVLYENPKYKSAKRNSYLSIDKYMYAQKTEYFNNKDNKWVHCADGGIVDNQGLQIILDQFQTNGIINKACNNADSLNPLKRMIFITVNAGVGEIDKIGKKVRPPSFVKVVSNTISTAIDNLSLRRLEELKQRSRDKREFLALKGIDLEPPYFIDISVRHLHDEQLRKQCDQIPTSFKLSKEQISLIQTTVKTLIKDNGEIKRLIGRF